jgi:glutathione S-transferase
MTIELFAHPFSSYSQKAFIAFYEHGIPFTLRELTPADPPTAAEHRALWPLAKMPVLRDDDTVLMETSIVVEYADRLRPAGAPARVPDDPGAALRVRMLDRICDAYVMTPVQKIVGDRLRPSDAVRDAFGVAEARSMLDASYAWLDAWLGEAGRDAGDWLCGPFSLADCAAAPALFYADWVHPIPEAQRKLRAYRARLLARPSFARAVDEARYFRPYFPGGAPDRD